MAKGGKWRREGNRREPRGEVAWLRRLLNSKGTPKELMRYRRYLLQELEGTILSLAMHYGIVAPMIPTCYLCNMRPARFILGTGKPSKAASPCRVPICGHCAATWEGAGPVNPSRPKGGPPDPQSASVT